MQSVVFSTLSYSEVVRLRCTFLNRFPWGAWAFSPLTDEKGSMTALFDASLPTGVTKSVTIRARIGRCGLKSHTYSIPCASRSTS